MKITRSVKCHYSWLTNKKKLELSSILKEYSEVVNWFIKEYESVIPEKTKYELILKEHIHKADTWLSARLVKNAFQEGYTIVQGTKESCKALNKSYSSPTHKLNTMTVSCTIATIDKNPSTKAFDLNVTLGSIGNKMKIHIPLKKHKQFIKWDSLGKLNSTVTVTDKYIQFSFEIDTGKKKTSGDLLGVDIGMNKLLATSDNNIYGDRTRSLIDKLRRKKRCSKAYYRCKEEIKEYLCKEVKNIPFNELRLLVCENLKGLKNKMKVKRRLTKNIRRVLTNWNYRFVLERIKALCEENRVSFRSVLPYYTSVTCSSCGHSEKRNRLNQESFYCVSCGYSDNADLNASKVILDRFLTGKYGSGFQTC